MWRSRAARGACPHRRSPTAPPTGPRSDPAPGRDRRHRHRHHLRRRAAVGPGAGRGRVDPGDRGRCLRPTAGRRAGRPPRQVGSEQPVGGPQRRRDPLALGPLRPAGPPPLGRGGRRLRHVGDGRAGPDAHLLRAARPDPDPVPRGRGHRGARRCRKASTAGERPGGKAGAQGPHTAGLPGRQRRHRGHVRGAARSTLGHPRRPRSGGGGRFHNAPRTRCLVDQLGWREDLPRRGREGVEGAPGRVRRRGGRRGRRTLRRAGLSGRPTPGRHRDRAHRTGGARPRAPGRLQGPPGRVVVVDELRRRPTGKADLAWARAQVEAHTRTTD